MSQADEVKTKLKTIAKILKMQVGPDLYDHGGHLITDFGGKIFVRLYGWKGKGTVSGSWPRDIRNQTHNSQDFKNEIGFSPDKTPELIARDIERRFLSEYREEYLKQLAIAEEWSESYRKADSAKAAIIAACGERYRDACGERQDFSVYLDDLRIECRVSSRSIDIKFCSIDLDLVLKLINMVKHEVKK